MQQSFHGSSYEQLMAQIRNRMRDQKVKEEAFEFLKNASENAINAQDAVLSRLEREKMLHAVMKEILNDILRQVDKA